MANVAEMQAVASVVRDIDSRAIGDKRFISQLDELRTLKQFLFEERIQFKNDELDALDLEKLNNLSYSSSGRAPTSTEWKTLDEKLSILASYLNEKLRRKIRIRELGFFFRILPICFLALSVVSTIAYINVPWITDRGSPWKLLIWLVVIMAWLISQGGLGACAFLGTSVIFKGTFDTEPVSSSDNLENIDVTDRNSLSIRIVLGTLFAVLLGLPYAVTSLNGLSAIYWKGGPPDESTLSVIFIPFIAGFSTNLVLAVLKRFVVAIEAFFGPANRR